MAINSKNTSPNTSKNSNRDRLPLGYKKSVLLEMFRQIYLIRQFELKAAEYYSRGEIRGFLHLYIGQEATGVGSIAALDTQDYIVSAYRDHGHALARGVDPKKAMAELFGKSSGLSKGKGGSMHFFDVEKKFMGGHAIVGGQIPLAVGLAFSQKYQNTNGLTVCYLGDGATNQGTYHESLNLAALWKLPVLFILENNMYGMGTAVNRVRASENDFYLDADKYGISSYLVDGMDILAVREASERAIEVIRSGKGPVLIEAKTFRFVGHSLADGEKYRDPDEITEWRKRDPIEKYPELLLENGIATKKELANVRELVDDDVNAAIDFAKQSLEPTVDDLFEDIYA